MCIHSLYMRFFTDPTRLPYTVHAAPTVCVLIYLYEVVWCSVWQCVAASCSVLQCVAVCCTCTLVSVDASQIRERTPNALPAKTASFSSFASSDAPQHSASTSRTMSCYSVFWEGNLIWIWCLDGCVCV